ncbi:hypothetical protein HY994_00555 [Candidatus Micrarchaeota archaeon]|nr:hypothetical protein [Candidatus Micrarchaeota archaeon]
MKNLEYAFVFVVVLVLAFAFFIYSPTPTGVQKDAYGNVIQSGQNQQLFQQQAATAGSDCGDLNDISNIQHLSHHPDRYGSCYGKIDPALLKQATGKTAQELTSG